MPVYKVLGDRIKKIRLENNMTQQEFAEALGYTHKSIIVFNTIWLFLPQ